MLRISSRIALTQLAIVVLFLALVAVVHVLDRRIRGEVEVVASSALPAALLSGSLIDEIDDMNANLLEYMGGEPEESEEFEANRLEFLGFYHQLQAIDQGASAELGELGRLFAIYENDARTRVFERFDPDVEHWAARRVAELERDHAQPLEQLLDLRKERRAGAGAEGGDISVYVELIDETGDMMRALSEYLRGEADASLRFESDAGTFADYFAKLRGLASEDQSRIATLFEGLRLGGREVFERYDATSRRNALATIEALERGPLAQMEALLESLAGSSRASADAGLERLVAAVGQGGRVLEISLLVMLALAFAIIAFSHAAIGRPIQQLYGRMAQLSGGETSVEIPHTARSDEIGEMAKAVQVFKENMIALKEQTRTLEALPERLGKYLSPQVYSQIFQGKKQVEVRAERKKLTIFFSDIVEFTQTTGDLEPEETAAILNRFLTEMSRIALAHGATIDKYVGDAIVAFFGDPESRGVEEDARACVRMALAMQRRMTELQQEWSDQGYERPLRMRVGINTGYCDVGNFGSADRMDYTIIGGEVNLAARLQSLAEPGGIVISYETWAHTKDLVKAEPGEPIHVKGIRREIVPYRVRGDWDALTEQGRVIRKRRSGLELRVDLAALEHAGEEAQGVRRAVVEDLEEALEQIRRTGARPPPGSTEDS